MPAFPAVIGMEGAGVVEEVGPGVVELNPDDLRQTAKELFDVVGSGAVKIEVNQRYPLTQTQAGRAHRDLEARATTGSSILLP